MTDNDNTFTDPLQTALDARLAEAVAENSAITDRLYDAVVESGKKNDYCREGMSDFIARVLGVPVHDVRRRVDSYYMEHVTIMIEATVLDRGYNHVTDNEAADFVASVLDCEVHDVTSASTSVTPTEPFVPGAP